MLQAIVTDDLAATRQEVAAILVLNGCRGVNLKSMEA
jgi:hypothetical protein